MSPSQPDSEHGEGSSPPCQMLRADVKTSAAGQVRGRSFRMSITGVIQILDGPNDTDHTSENQKSRLLKWQEREGGKQRKKQVGGTVGMGGGEEVTKGRGRR